MKIPEAINGRLQSRRFGERSPGRFALYRKEDHMNQIMKRNGKRNKVKNRKYDYAAMITMAVLLLMPMNAFAAAQVQGKINNRYSIVTTIITAAGAIVLAWGVFEFASAYQSRDTAQQTDSLKKVVAGILMCLAPTIINLLK